MILLKDIMSKKVATIEPADSIINAAKTMAKKNIGCLVVMKNKKPIGMITERDLMKKIIATNKDYKTMKVEDIMHSPITTVTGDLSIVKASDLITNKGFRRLPVAEDGKLQGIVTETDITKALRFLLTDSLQKFINDISK